MLKKIEGLEPEFPAPTASPAQNALSVLPPNYLNMIATPYYGSNRGIVRIPIDCVDLTGTTAEQIRLTLIEKIAGDMGTSAVVRSVSLSEQNPNRIEVTINTESGLGI